MRYIKYGAVVLLIAAVAYLGYHYINDKRKIAEQAQSKKQVAEKIQKEAKEIKRQVDEKGIESVLYDISANRGTLQDHNVSKSTRGTIDTTAMALDIRTKQLREIMIVKGALAADNLRLRRQLDSSKRVVYTYRGNGLNLRFTPPDFADSNSVATADFTADVQIKATQYWKRNWFLGAKKSILSVTSNNPMFKINGADFIEIEQKQPTFGFRVQASGNFNPQTGAYGFGPAARFDIGRVSFQGNYTYYPNTQTWRPSINANYDLVRF